MVREIVSWCDPCMGEEGEANREPAQEIVVSIGKAKPRRIDLCERHRKELVDSLQQVLSEYGVVVDSGIAAPTKASPVRVARAASPTKNPGGPTCQVPDCPSGARPFKNVNTLFTHARRIHDMSAADYRQTYGEPASETDPQEALDLDGGTPAEDFTCGIDDCTVTYPPDKYNRPSQALGVHRAQAHGIKGESRDAIRKRQAQV